jgi:nitrate reductase gamma subunit
MKDNFLFQDWPYVALAISAVGLILRAVLLGEQCPVWDGSRSEARHFFARSRMWSMALLLLLALHLVGLMFPTAILRWDRVPTRLYTLEAFGFLGGAMALAGWCALLRRHFGRPLGTAFSQIADAVLLSQLFTLLASGLGMTMIYRWASSWGALTITPYIASLTRGKSTIGLLAEMPFLVRLHVFSAFVTIAVLPFSRASVQLIAATRSWFDFLLRPLAWIGRSCGKVLQRSVRKYDVAALLWPEED